jgi:hypothetical protein
MDKALRANYQPRRNPTGFLVSYAKLNGGIKPCQTVKWEEIKVGSSRRLHGHGEHVIGMPHRHVFF